MIYLKTLLLASTALTLTFCGGNKPKPEPEPEPEVKAPAPTAPVNPGPSEEELLQREIQELRKEISSQTIYFDFNQSSLSAENRAILDHIRHLLQKSAAASISIRIEGHTDAVGSEEYNLALGEKRAQIVKDYLVQSGADASKLSTISYGEEKLAIDSEGKESKNRRSILDASN